MADFKSQPVNFPTWNFPQMPQSQNCGFFPMGFPQMPQYQVGAPLQFPPPPDFNNYNIFSNNYNNNFNRKDFPSIFNSYTIEEFNAGVERARRNNASQLTSTASSTESTTESEPAADAGQPLASQPTQTDSRSLASKGRRAD